MTCSDFMASFSDYVDGVCSQGERRRMEEHLESCPACLKYEQAYRKGLDVLRASPELSLPDGFEPQLNLRIRRERVLPGLGVARPIPASGASFGLVFGMAVVLIGIAWAPFLLEREAQVDLPAIVVSTPPARPLPVRLPDIQLLPGRPLGASPFRAAELWDEPTHLLRQYAPVLRAYTTRSGLGLD